MASFIERYQRGEMIEVWQELIDQDAGVRSAPLAEEAQAVADEAMARVRRNVERLVAALEAGGYRFERREGALCDPAPDTEERLARMERDSGPLPVAVKAFYRQIGEIDLRGSFEGWEPPGPFAEGAALAGFVDESRCYPDPLVVPPLAALSNELEERADELAEVEAEEALLVAFSGDAVAKRDGDESGGLYGILLPDPAFDTDLEAHNPTTFGDYLRDALRWAGFPGWIAYAEPPVEQIEALRADFEPF